MEENGLCVAREDGKDRDGHAGETGRQRVLGALASAGDWRSAWTWARPALRGWGLVRSVGCGLGVGEVPCLHSTALSLCASQAPAVKSYDAHVFSLPSAHASLQEAEAAAAAAAAAAARLASSGAAAHAAAATSGGAATGGSSRPGSTEPREGGAGEGEGEQQAAAAAEAAVGAGLGPEWPAAAAAGAAPSASDVRVRARTGSGLGHGPSGLTCASMSVGCHPHKAGARARIEPRHGWAWT